MRYSLVNQVSSKLSRIYATLVAFAAMLLTAGALQVRHLLTFAFGPLLIGPVPALIVISGLLVGPIGVVGCIIGFLAYFFHQGFVPLWEATGYLALGLLAWLSWDALRPIDGQNRPQFDFLSQLRRFVPTAVFASFGSAALVVLGYVVTNQFPFFPTVLYVGFSQILSIVIGGLIFAMVSRLFGKQRWQSSIRPSSSRCLSVTYDRSSWITLSAMLLFAWIVLGSAVSVVFQVVELVPPLHIRSRGLDPALLLKSSGPFEHGGVTLQIGLGVATISLWLLSLRRYNLVSQLLSDTEDIIDLDIQNK